MNPKHAADLVAKEERERIAQERAAATEPGPSFDRFIAGEILGCPTAQRIGQCRCEDEIHGTSWPDPPCVRHEIKRYSTDMGAAWEVVEHLTRLKGGVSALFQITRWSLYHVSFSFEVQGTTGQTVFEDSKPTAPHAICLAAMKAKGLL